MCIRDSLRKGAEIEHLVDRRSVGARDARRRSGRPARLAAKAQRHAAGNAELAMAAKGAEAGDDRIARLHRADFATHRLDDPGSFMAGDGGQGVRIGAVDEVQVRMAKPAGGGADTHFVRCLLYTSRCV